jgi:diguanylate cyclase (GGDEF)-like protein
MVVKALTDAPGVAWFRVRESRWLVDLSVLREDFELKLDWLQGTVVVEPEYDILPDRFHPEQLRGMLCLVVDRSSLQPAPEAPWDEYPDDELAELVPLLRRRSFDRDIQRLYDNAAPERVSALALLDLDHFKRVNDERGHLAGDAVLIRTAEILRTVAGRRGRAYRYGGEELALLLPDFTVDEAMPLVERVRESVQSERWSKFADLAVTVSTGVTAAQGGVNSQAVIKAADEALYRAKTEGRNRVART